MYISRNNFNSSLPFSDRNIQNRCFALPRRCIFRIIKIHSNLCRRFILAILGISNNVPCLEFISFFWGGGAEEEDFVSFCLRTLRAYVYRRNRALVSAPVTHTGKNNLACGRADRCRCLDAAITGCERLTHAATLKSRCKTISLRREGRSTVNGVRARLKKITHSPSTD